VLRTLIVLALLVLTVSSATAQDKGKSWLRGNWEGSGYQTDTDSTWPMRLTIRKLKSHRRTFSIDYPSLNCGGRWKVLSSNRSRATFREQLDRGQDKCTDHGLVRIERVGHGQLIFLYSRQGRRDLTASALLSRKKT
jgi:hypothetical protein